MARRTRNQLPQLTRAHKIALIAGPLVLAPIIVIGVIVENRTGSTTTTSPATATATTQPAAKPSSPAPPTLQPGDPEERENPTDLTFGQTARFISTAGDNNIPLEFTVSAPTPFTPGKNALYFDAVSSVGGKGTRQATNVYFTLTITNTSTTQTYDPNFVFSHLSGTGNDDQISRVVDDDIEGLSDLSGKVIKPGKSVTIKDGYSVKSASSVRYELAADGLAGTSFYYSK